MPLYAAIPAVVAPGEEPRCSWVACRFGHGGDHPVRPRRYTPGMTDTAQAIAPLRPWPAWRMGRGGHPEEYCRRRIVDAIRYVVDNGCTWRNLPAAFPPFRTVHAWFSRWGRGGDTRALHNDLREQVRQAEGRDAEPPAAVIDAQAVRAAAAGGAPTRGWDAGKQVGGRKRHVIVDCLGLRLVVLATAASVQDRAAARPALTVLRELYAKVTLVWADGGYAGKLVDGAKDKRPLTLGIVKRSGDTRGFVVLPRRWVVERSLSWLSRRRRGVRDYER